MKWKHFLLSTLVLFASVSILILWSYREQALSSLLSGEGIPKYISIGYYDGMEESHIVGAISEESIADLLYSTTVRKGTSYRAMPSPCFEITVIYSNETYRVIVGADHTISVAPIRELHSRTFWIDTSGELFEQLYNIHLENGGQEFPQLIN